jgi:hypothetical protein
MATARPGFCPAAFLRLSQEDRQNLISENTGENVMGCLKGKSKTKPKPGTYECPKCAAVSKKKSDLCKAKKIKDEDKDKKK